MTAVACTRPAHLGRELANIAVLGSLTSGSTMAITAANVTAVFALTVPQSYQNMILLSPDLDTGTGYALYSGGERLGAAPQPHCTARPAGITARFFSSLFIAFYRVSWLL